MSSELYTPANLLQTDKIGCQAHQNELQDKSVVEYTCCFLVAQNVIDLKIRN